MMENNRQDEIEIDLLEIFFLIKKRLWILLLAGAIFASAAGVYTHYFVQPVYSSTAKLYILTKSTSITSLADIQVGSSLSADYVQLIQSRPVVEQVIENLKLNRSYEAVLSQLSVYNLSNTRFIVITVQDGDPQLAKDMVDEFSEVAKVSISTIMKTDAPTSVEHGYVSNVPISPNIRKNIMIGGLLGFILAAGIVVVLYLIDDTVKSAEDIEKYLGLNTLASIPLVEEDKKTSAKGKDKQDVSKQKSDKQENDKKKTAGEGK